ncbi:mitochondrial ribosomal large subunit component [Xylographa trunciseda]|nr:mitochondrial ribosomal large subunit component [Xylographa trunciseda]
MSSCLIARPSILRPTHTPQQPRLVLRAFSSTPSILDWLAPKRGHNTKSRKGRPRIRTGGSTRGTTVVWGDYGLRMRDHDRRISAKAFQIGAETIKKRLRGLKYKFFTRVSANIAVFSSGNEVRMGKGKGSFDYWASRVSVSKIIFEVKGELHEQVVRDAFRLAAAKMPGLYEFVRKGDAPVMGITKVPEGVTLEDMNRPRRLLPLEGTAARLPAATPP